MRRFLKLLKKFDWPLFVTVIILSTLGLVLVYSTTTTEEVRFSNEFTKQLIAFGFGVILIFVFSFFDYSILKNYAYVLYIALIILLIMVLIFGKEVNGTKGWFDLGFFRFQPSEFGKVAILVLLAKYFASVSGRNTRFQFILISGILVFIPFFLVLLQPDLGSAMVYLAMWLGLLLFSGIKRIHKLILFGSGLVVTWMAWLFMMQPYQKQRIACFLNPEADPLGFCYNIIQAKIAVGSGGFMGRGLGQGPMGQLHFLPEQHTDFIFAVLTEDLGFVGGFLLLFLFFLMLSRIVKICRSSRDEFGIMLAIGAVIMFVFQIFTNIGMN
ncbi:rod shape-determining protein RodA, partial [Patescibacteria group bacterium]|nr:rod shape-determining protein RodA [Patescibacteria group bacterium]